MDFSSLSASRIEARSYPCDGKDDVELREFQNQHGKRRGGQKAVREVFDALFATVEGDIGNLSDNLIDANVSFGELSSLTEKDLELIGCTDEKQRSSLIEFFKLLPKQDHSYAQILQSKEAQLYNETILKRTSCHMDAMRSALSAANYKLKIIPSEDVVVGEKNFASRFVLDALEELQRVTNEIEVQLNALEKEAKLKSTEHKRSGLTLKFSILIPAALGTWLGFLIWKSFKSK